MGWAVPQVQPGCPVKCAKFGTPGRRILRESLLISRPQRPGPHQPCLPFILCRGTFLFLLWARAGGKS